MTVQKPTIILISKLVSLKSIKHLHIVVLCVVLFACNSYATFPTIEQGDISPNDKRLDEPINKSKQDELTIASFNIRNLGVRKRSLKDFESIVDLIDEADVILIQEAGLGIYKNKNCNKRMKAVVAVLQINLGDKWAVLMAPNPSGTGGGIETTILAYRKTCNSFTISEKWESYVNLGDKRDMAVFQLKLLKGSESKDIYIGSVHLTPEDPDRGQQMIKASDWLVSQKQKRAIVMGDFNWGYKKTSGVKNYEGELRIMKLHNEGELFQLFNSLSYLGKGDNTKLRTNMGFRKSAYFYDQFIMTPILAPKMADGGKLLEDCGILAFGIHYKPMIDVIGSSEEKRNYGLKKYMKNAQIQPENNQAAYLKTQKQVELQAQNDATYVISDHRVIWMQLKVW